MIPAGYQYTTKLAIIIGSTARLNSPNQIWICNDTMKMTTTEVILRVAGIGIGATAIMDGWAFVLRMVGVKSMNFVMLGRWIGHMTKGQWFHESIATASPIKGELLIGWSAHYVIGVTFAALLILLYGTRWMQAPALWPALLIGLVTVVAPLFVLQPAFGFGIASSKTSAPVFNATKSVVTHLVYGLGLYLSALTISRVLPVKYHSQSHQTMESQTSLLVPDSTSTN